MGQWLQSMKSLLESTKSSVDYSIDKSKAYGRKPFADKIKSNENIIS